MILGIDPGYDITGFAVLQQNPKAIELVDCGVIRTDKADKFATRLVTLRRELLSLIQSHEIAQCAIEKLYFSVNKKSAIQVASARGVILEVIESSGITSYDYSPNQVKKAITGSGRASKSDIQMMVKRLLNLDSPIKQDDACDAVAIGICHLHTSRLGQYHSSIN